MGSHTGHRGRGMGSHTGIGVEVWGHTQDIGVEVWGHTQDIGVEVWVYCMQWKCPIMQVVDSHKPIPFPGLNADVGMIFQL